MTARPSRRWLQFSLRTFVIVITLFSAWLGYISFRVREQRTAVARIKELGGHFQYDYQWGVNPKPSPPGWSWLRRLVGDEPFQDVVFIRLDETTVSDTDLLLVSKLRRTRILCLDRTEISDQGLMYIRGMSELKHLGLAKTKVTTDGIRGLPQPRNGCYLILENTGVGDEALANLAGCQALALDGTRITSRGIQELADSKNLSQLSFQRTAVDDAAVPALGRIQTLTWLLVSDTKISGEGLLMLRDALPKCQIDGPIADFSNGFNPAAPPALASSSWSMRVSHLMALNKIQHIQHLKLLVLPDTVVTDSHLTALEGLDHLETLDLRGSSVTDAGVEKLQKALPKLKIHADNSPRQLSAWP